MNVLVINLKRSEARLSFMSQQLERLNINFIRVEAVDAYEIDSNLYNKHSYDWNRVLRRSELACFFSHKKAWEYVVKKREPSIIFEDDVVLSKSIVDVLKHISKLQKYNFINLETSSRKKLVLKKNETLSDRFYLSRLLHNKTGAAAYLLSPKFADFLLTNFQKRGVALADAAIYDNYFKIPQYQLVPAVAIQIQECKYFGLNEPFEHVSNIATNEKPRAHKSRLKFGFKRFKVQIMNFLVYLRYLFRSRLKIIPYDNS
jgi:glycosyl transferase family 25